MKAIVFEEYGSSDLLALRDVELPSVTDDGVLVRVQAASINPVDWHTMTGTPYLVRVGAGLRKPKRQRLGTDIAGTVEAVGREVTEFRLGDEVFGVKGGSFAEYAAVPERQLVLKPRNVSFEQAAAVPVAAITALQALRDGGRVEAGQRVLINGAAGGVGTFAVQIARSFGAQVTGVCSTTNVDMVRSIGADRVIDYVREDFTQGDDRYDVMLDVVGSRPWSQYRRVLAEKAIVVVVGGPSTNKLLGPLSHMLRSRVLSTGASQTVIALGAKTTKDDLVVLEGLLRRGVISPVIDRRYSLAEVPQALTYVEEGHARGKVVIAVTAS